MVKAIIDISEDANYVLNLIKAVKGLRTKSQAIEVMSDEYYELYLDSLPLKKSYVKKMKKIEKEKPVFTGTMEDFRKRFGK